MSQRRRRIWVQPLSTSQRDGAKASFATRRVPRDAMRTLVCGTVRPRSGDVVLARVGRLGQHRRIERPDGRRAGLHVDDEIIVAYGDRYATDQFEAHVPDTLGPTQLVASGGIASSMITRSLDVRNATDIVPIGLVGDETGRPLNVANFALQPAPRDRQRPRTIAVLGTSMNSGKTTTIHYLVHGLSRAGLRPGATKVTGTGSGGDYWVMLDAGAHRMLDFTDVGLASTYRQAMPVIERKFTELVNHLTDSGSGINLVEVADGIYQRETAPLIESKVFRSTIDAVLFAAGDAMGAAAGVAHLRGLGHEVLAVSGRITRSPLATREAEGATGLPVLNVAQLCDPGIIFDLLGLDPAVVPEPVASTEPTWRVSLPGLGPVPEPTELDEDDEAPLDDDFVLSDEIAAVHLAEQR
jgi:hypothetical protein